MKSFTVDHHFIQEQYYSVSEVYVNAVVLEGYYLPDPHTHRSEAEAGSILPFLDDPQTPAPASSSVMMFPNFSGRGFAILNYPIGTNVCATLYPPSQVV